MITAIGMIKNAADVIETYIRANSLIVDNFVLLDNQCTDRTLEILASLQGEGFQIEIVKDEEVAYLQSKKMTALAKYAIEKYQSDFIIPIDDDEILVSSEGCDARLFFEMAPKDIVFYIKWRIYVPWEEDDQNELCVANRQKVCFDRRHATYEKVIIPKEVCLMDGFKIGQGNHFIDTTEEHKEYRMEEITMAHFPCRSLEQLKAKALVGWTNYLVTARRDEWGEHWHVLYDRIKNQDALTIEDAWQFCAMYLSEKEDVELQVESLPLNLDTKAYEIRYTGANECNALRNYMETVEIIAEKYMELAKG